MNHWSQAYLGFPYRDLGRDRSGVDCWGLVRLPYSDIAGIDLPSYAGDYASTEERAEIDAIVGAAKKSPYWRQLPSVEVPQPLDLVVFSQGKLESHVGALVWAGHMLHATRGRPSCIEPIDSFPWSTRPRVYGRHVRMEGRVL